MGSSAALEEQDGFFIGPPLRGEFNVRVVHSEGIPDARVYLDKDIVGRFSRYGYYGLDFKQPPEGKLSRAGWALNDIWVTAIERIDPPEDHPLLEEMNKRKSESQSSTAEGMTDFSKHHSSPSGLPVFKLRGSHLDR